jgi:hypothetical protein
MRRSIAVLACVASLAACGADSVYAPPEEVTSRAYAAGGPPTLTLLTAINNRTGGGAHSALMVSGSQRVIFDPAGTWWHPNAPERGDVKFGITDPMLDIYVDYHARPTFRMVLQEITVPPETAERALALVQSHGPAAKATCGVAISGLLRELGFQEVGRTWYPDRVMRDFAALSGVRETVIRDDTIDANSPGRRIAYDASGNVVQPF